MDRLGRSAVSRGIMLPSTLEFDRALRTITEILAHRGISCYRNLMDCLGDHCIWWDSMEQHGAPWNSVGIIMSRSGLEGNDYLYILNLLAYRGAAWDANC